ncbi:MAG: acetate/propionate family kinase [Reyranella sp.]|uniref:acetate/propionate family kinase n=1 Tax=Reyranella sp. TaxID=1929291 RepID=UPI001AC52BA1|nr:acetate/propionate family kinase [Reyranella sp.]MBN9086551.1 acetate/propionate family kinase [Reyranella sp.]
MSGCVAVLNAGSSSIKFAIYRADGLDLMFRGQIERIGSKPRLRVFDAAHKPVVEREWAGNDLDHRAATEEIVRTGRQLIGDAQIHAVGHRVAHGGAEYAVPVRVDAKVVETLARLIPLAPLHQPHNLEPIRVIAQAMPDLPQVACFDTAFHRSQPPLAQAFALPRKLSEEGVRRYGFHGLSYEFIVTRLRELDPALAARRLVIAHLGNGASLAAVRDGRSVASTMGFTAVDGLMMGTRTGSIDPGVILYLMDSRGMDARAVESLIYNESGLLGVSGLSSDMRTLRQLSALEAREAIDLFIYRIVREIGSMAAALGGLDGVVFTGGIGENDVATRAEVAAQCGWLGLVLDEARNEEGEGRISAASSSIAAWVIPTDEERMIARHTMAVVTR